MVNLLSKCCIFVMVMIVLVTHSGCSIFLPTEQTDSVVTSERDAKIYINGSFSGTGMASLSVKRNENVAIMAKKDGYYPVTRNISKTMSPIGIVDVIGGCIWLVPFVGLLAPGAWEVQQTNVTLQMEEKTT